MRRFFFAITTAVVLTVSAAVLPTPAEVQAPPQLVRVLAELQRLDDQQFLKVTAWAQGRESGSIRAIDNLESGQKYAIMQWLRGNGRHDLYNLHVTDAEIGPERVGADSPGPTPAPTALPWRELAMSNAGGAADASNIAFVDGFGAARPSGTGMTLCVSFQNNAAKTAKSVHFDFVLQDQNGAPIATIPFDRKGTFSSGVAIRTYASFLDFVNSGFNLNPNYNENCVSRNTDVANVQSLTYQVTHVEYDDGTSWTASGHTAAATLPLALERLPHLNSWTYYPTVNALLNQPPDGSGIEILRGFGAVPDGGSDIDVCIAFRNKGTKTATRIDMLYTLMGADGRTFGDLPFVRKGEFSPGVEVQTFTFTQFATLMAPTNHGFWDNCVFHKTKTPPVFNPAMYLIIYRVTSVEYADGTRWSAQSSPSGLR